ncbi:hypothetical protein O0I10_011948 [Lichtheimia ornata]|uniref:Uncharacterized protein n=1 Tax=Lichtheimia ornata TaxID=688661 RepID=A0AAD7USI0_9FUNG|nr:uncharacterized protein O0I10_011948 [Lichtheimia ornata]KAJ8652420.1 hypothetical protein O0I10_011948 [Lichtheimia ornata]
MVNRSAAIVDDDVDDGLPSKSQYRRRPLRTFGADYTGLAHTRDDALEQNEEGEFDDTHTPPNVPACGAQEYATFMQAIQPSLDRNAKIPSNTFCPLSEAIITIPTS